MIRRYTKEDIAEIIKLETKVLNTTLGDGLVTDLDNPFARHFVYILDDKVVGYISSIFDGEMISIENFCVDCDYQNKHIGSSLLKHLLDSCYNEEPTLIKGAILEVRETNERAIHVYSRFGFNVIYTRKNYYSNNENALVMQMLFN